MLSLARDGAAGVISCGGRECSTEACAGPVTATLETGTGNSETGSELVPAGCPDCVASSCACLAMERVTRLICGSAGGGVFATGSRDFVFFLEGVYSQSGARVGCWRWFL